MFFSFFILRNKIENKYNRSYSYIPFSVCELGKRKRNVITVFLFSIVEWENESERTVYTAHDAFPFSLFYLQNKNKHV